MLLVPSAGEDVELALQSATTNKSEIALALDMFLIPNTSGNFTSDSVRGVQYLRQLRWHPPPSYPTPLPAMPHNHKGFKCLMLYDPILS